MVKTVDRNGEIVNVENNTNNGRIASPLEGTWLQSLHGVS
jgi:hypothetical protein